MKTCRNFYVFSASRTDVNDFTRYPANSRAFAAQMLKKIQAAHPERDNGIESHIDERKPAKTSSR